MSHEIPEARPRADVPAEQLPPSVKEGAEMIARDAWRLFRLLPEGLQGKCAVNGVRANLGELVEADRRLHIDREAHEIFDNHRFYQSREFAWKLVDGHIRSLPPGPEQAAWDGFASYVFQDAADRYPAPYATPRDDDEREWEEDRMRIKKMVLRLNTMMVRIPAMIERGEFELGYRVVERYEGMRQDFFNAYARERDRIGQISSPPSKSDLARYYWMVAVYSGLTTFQRELGDGAAYTNLFREWDRMADRMRAAVSDALFLARRG